MSHNRQFSGSWRTLRKLSYVGLIWMSICFICFCATQTDVTQGLREYEVKSMEDRWNLQYFSTLPPRPGLAYYVEKQRANMTKSGRRRRVHVPGWLPDYDELLAHFVHVSNVPLCYWDEKIPAPPISPKSCVKFPALWDIMFNNVYWQRLYTNNGSFFLYGAYLDVRERAGKHPVIRVLSMIDRIKPPTIYCLLWYDNATMPVVSLASYTYAWYPKWGNYKDGILQPFVMSCPAPLQKGRTMYPSSVSIVDKQCGMVMNNLRVNYEVPEKKEDFAVCVKGLDFLREDLSVRLVEWIELLNILGAKKIFFYELEVHPNISKVLDYYSDAGIVDVTPINLPGDMPNIPSIRHQFLKQKMNHKRQNELIPYNDCLYRNLYKYEYIALLDIDEVIMPINHQGWADLMKDVVPAALKERNYTRASYNFRNVYFMDDMLTGEEMQHEMHEDGIPHYMHMLQHVYRAKNFTGPGAFVKCFHNTERVVTLHNHFPLNCFGSCTTYSVPPEEAQLQHYRKDCVGPLKKSCSQYKNITVRDTTIWRYKDELISRVTRTLEELKFLNVTPSGVEVTSNS